MAITVLEDCGKFTLKSWLAIWLFLSIVYYLISWLRSYLRLRHIPGPRIAAISNLWWFKAATSRRTNVALAEVCDTYGKLTRIAPNIVVTSDAELFRKMNAWRGSVYTRSNWYKAFRFDADKENVFSSINEEDHTFLRKRITPGYSGRENANLEHDIDQVLWSLVSLITARYLSRGSVFKPMDYAKISVYLTLDVITAIALGGPFGFIADNEDKYRYIEMSHGAFPILNFISVVPLLRTICHAHWFQKLALPSVQDEAGLGKAKAVARAIISRRFGENKEIRQDMTGSFITHGLTKAEIADESLLQILAGSDTTSTVLRSGFLSVISNPSVYARLQAECSSVEDVPLSSMISQARALQLPYLQACISEAVRHNPPATGLFPKVVGPQGDTHNGVYLPPGTEVGVCVWNMHRNNKAVYGDDTGVYRPERWLEANPEQLNKMKEAIHLVFGHGRFRCLGENIARLELNKMFFEMFRRFDWSLVDPMRPMEDDRNYGLFIQSGMWVKVSARQE